MKFHGEFDELSSRIDQLGIPGHWEEDAVAKSWRFRAKTGEVLNWWKNTGTLAVQGSNPEVFKAAVQSVIEAEAPALAVKGDRERRIFVVHGHDREARDQLELILLRLGLQPFILQNEDGGGRTIIEALEQNIYREAAFGVVLMTPDDYGYTKAQTDADRRPRPRQNVVLELGMVMASLGRGRIAILQKGALERPSDTDGILRIEFNDHVREIVPKLVQRLQAAGFDIDAKAIAAASA